jgi:hypothetical protein
LAPETLKAPSENLDLPFKVVTIPGVAPGAVTHRATAAHTAAPTGPTTGGTVSILDRLPRRPSCTTHLDADHAHLLLDALALAERMIEQGHRPWTDYDNPDPADPKTTEAGYLDLFAAAVNVLVAIVDSADAEGGPLLVRQTREAAHACASLNLHTEPADTEAGDRSPRVLADLLGITVEVRRRADHTAVHLDITGLPHDAGPVRVSARTTDTGPVARPRVTILELPGAGR